MKEQLYAPPAAPPYSMAFIGAIFLRPSRWKKNSLNDLTDADRIAMPAMRFVVSTNSVQRKDSLMKLIFTWTRARCPLLARVQFALSPLHSRNFLIFSPIQESYQEVKRKMGASSRKRTLFCWDSPLGGTCSRPISPDQTFHPTQGFGPCGNSINST